MAMAVAVLYSRALAGMQAPLVTVEAHLANGLPNFTIVGLPEAEVREAKDRVRAALQNARFEFPQRRITINLAPADLPKVGNFTESTRAGANGENICAIAEKDVMVERIGAIGGQ